MRGGNGRFLADDLLVAFAPSRGRQQANSIVQASNGRAGPAKLDG